MTRPPPLAATPAGRVRPWLVNLLWLVLLAMLGAGTLSAYQAEQPDRTLDVLFSPDGRFLAVRSDSGFTVYPQAGRGRPFVVPGGRAGRVLPRLDTGGFLGAGEGAAGEHRRLDDARRVAGR